ncbi:MAG: adenylate/guanylate cyclase domain-containing protein [Rhodospirillales bacterium]
MKKNIIDLSFFNFRNAITAAYFANMDLRILRVNDNFKKFFPVLDSVTNAYFPDVLVQLGVPGEQIDHFVSNIEDKGFVQIPAIHIRVNGEERVYSLLSTRTNDDVFSYLNSIQGQFVDRTAEWHLRKEREELLEQKVRDQEIIEEKSCRLENLATRLAKYLSPQIYESIFTDSEEARKAHARKNLTVFFSDIVKFTDLTDILEPERLATVINTYLSEMASIALDCGGTIDKFIGDSVFVFFGDPESNGEIEDALKCVEMALRMRSRVAELQKYWLSHGILQEMRIRMGIATGYCTVGNFGSEQRLDYTALGRPVNLAARLEGLAKPDGILIDENTHGLIHRHVNCERIDQVTLKGFVRPVQVYQVGDFFSEEHREKRQRLSRVGKHVEVNVIDSSDIRALIDELRHIQEDFEKQLGPVKK